MQLAVPQFDTKDYHSGQFYNSFISIREKLETLLLNFKLGKFPYRNFELKCIVLIRLLK